MFLEREDGVGVGIRTGRAEADEGGAEEKDGEGEAEEEAIVDEDGELIREQTELVLHCGRARAVGGGFPCFWVDGVPEACED